MAYRKLIFGDNEIYHVYNRGVEKRPIFLMRKDYLRFMELVNYYRFVECPLKYSHFKELSNEAKISILEKLENSKKHVDIFAFCLMPNHIHLLLKQLVKDGVSKFVSKVQNAFSHYFNIRHERVGHLFQGNFSAKRILNDNQLLHVSRYIHLNPVSNFMIELKDLDEYEYSSYREFITNKAGFCNTKEILSYLKDAKDYKQFVCNQADYARKLENIKHLLLEN